MVDRCPGALALHDAQDGLLARVRVPGGRLRSHQLGALARAAALGNGLVDLTSRANVQVRGLSADHAEDLATLLHDAGLLPSPAHDRVRNVIASPVAGRHPDSVADTDAVVDAIDLGLCADPGLAELPGRFLFAVDDGSRLALDHPADVALIAVDASTYAVALGGLEAEEHVPAPEAHARARAAAHAFLDHREETGGRAWRIAELPDGPAAVAARLGMKLSGRPCPRGATALRPGTFAQSDGRVALTGLVPLGRVDRETLEGLAPLAAEHGGEVRLATGRTLTLVDVEPGGEAASARRLLELGLVLDSGSGWAGLTACAGLGRCPKARVDVRSAAALRAAARRPGAPDEHWAACDRRCGERGTQPVAVAALENGIAIRDARGERVVPGVEEALAAVS